MKNLPVYKTLEYTETLPLSKKVVTFRPYNVGDEKNLIAAASVKDTDPDFYIINTINVIQNAILNGVSISSLPAVDVRLLLLKQRAKSVGEIIEFNYDKKLVSINIDALYIKNTRDKDSYDIPIGNDYKVRLRDLNFGDEVRATAQIKKGMEHEIFYRLVTDSVVSIYNEEDVWVVGEDISREDAEQFIHSIPKEKAKAIYEFIENTPVIAADIEVDGKTVTVTDKDVDFLSSVQAT